MNIGKLKKWMVTGIVVLLIIALGTALGYFTAMAIARYNTNAANLITSIQGTDGIQLNVSINDDEYFYQGQGRDIQYSVKNQGITASDNKDVLVFTFTNSTGNPIAVSKENAPIQLYRADDVVLNPDTMEYTVKEGATPIVIKYSAGNALTYEFEYSLDGNNDLDEYQDVGIGTDTVQQHFVVVFDSNFASASDFAEATITLNLATSSKIYDRWLTVWDDQETYITSTVMNVVSNGYVCSVYSTDGTYIGSYTSLAKGFEAAEQTAAKDAAGISTLSLANKPLTDPRNTTYDYLVGTGAYDHSGKVYVRIEMLVDNYRVKQPITLTTPYLITLSSNPDAYAEASGATLETGNFTLINGGLTAMFTVPEGSALRLEHITIDGDSVNGNIISNYGDLYTTNVSTLTDSAAPAIYNGATGIIYTDGVNINGCVSDIGAAIYSTGLIYVAGDNQINGNVGTAGQESNIFLGSEASCIYMKEGFDTNSDIGVSGYPYFDKTWVYTLDTDRYASDYTANFTFQREDVLSSGWNEYGSPGNVSGFTTHYYDAEFYVAHPWAYVFNADEENQVYTYYPINGYHDPIYKDISVPRLGNFAPTITVDGITYTFTTMSNTQAYIDNNSCLRELWVPETVTTIENGTISNCPNLTRVYIMAPEFVSSPNYNNTVGIFTGSTKLTHATVQKNVIPENEDAENTIYLHPDCTTITAGAFTAHYDLVEIDFANSVISAISNNCFANCTSLKNVYLSTNAMQTVGISAFQNCTALEYIDFGKALTYIGDSAFRGCSSLNNVVLPDTLGTINAHAFRDCTSLTEITVPANITRFGWGVFNGCTSLNKVYWNVISVGNDNSVGYYSDNNPVFAGCPNLKYVTGQDIDNAIVISPSTTKIPTLFARMESLISADFTGLNITALTPECFKSSAIQTFNSGNNMQTIDNGTFQDCAPLYQATIGTGITYVSTYAFNNCTSLNKVYWNAISTTSTYSYLAQYPIFNNCTSLYYITTEDIDNAIVIGDGVTHLQRALAIKLPNLVSVTLKDSDLVMVPPDFCNACPKLKTVELPENCIDIGYTAFYNCSVLDSVEMPDVLAQIGDNAFKNCTSLPEIIVPESVVKVGVNVFQGCTALHKVYWNSANSTNFNIYNSTNGVFRDDALLTKITHEDVDNAIIIGPNVQTFPIGVFAYMPELVSADFSQTIVTELSKECFKSCPKLISYTTSPVLVKIGADAFNTCTALPEVVIPESVTYIGNYAFYNCTSLNKVYFNAVSGYINYLDYPQNYPPFTNCPLLTKITHEDVDGAIIIGPNVVTLQDAIFANMANLVSVDFSQTNVQNVSNYCFNNDKLLTSVIFNEETLTHLGSQGFQGCTALPEIIIPKSVTVSGTYTFNGCTNLHKVYWNAVSTTADYYAYPWNKPMFYNCPLLKYITPEDMDNAIVVSPDVTDIALGSFAQMPSLESADLSQTKLTAFSQNLFYKCNKLTSVEYSDAVTAIGMETFAYCTALPTITIRENVTSLSRNAFTGCSSLSKVYFNAINTDYYYYDSIWNYPPFTNCPLLTQITTEDVDNAIVLNPNIETLSNGIFARMNNLVSVDLRNTKLTRINGHTFQHNPALTEVLLPESIVQIDEYAFANCDALTSIVLKTNGLATVNNAFPATITIYCTGPDGCITGTNSSWTIYYNLLSSENAVVDENGVIQSLIGDRWNNTVNLDYVVYLTENNTTITLTGINPALLTGSNATSLVLPSWYTADKFDIALLSNATSLKTVTFNGTGFKAELTNIFTNSNVDTVYYINDNGEQKRVCRPTAGYTVDDNGVITNIDASVVTGNTFVIPDEVWAVTSADEYITATGIAAGAMNNLSATNITVPMSIKTLAVDAFPATLTELSIHNNNLNTKEFRLALFTMYQDLEVIHGAVADFTLLESVTSSGNNWLDTGIYGSEKLDIETSFIQHQNNSSYQAIFGSRYNSTSRVYGYFGIFAGNNSLTKVFAHYNAETRYNFSSTFFDTLQHIKTDGATAYVTINGETVAIVSNAGTYTTPKTIYLWCMNSNGNAVDYAKVTMQYFRMWENGTLVREFVPALDANGVVCMYDTVTGRFFYANTGTLIAGEVSTDANPNYTMQDFTRP